ncbi:WG repeat-containing protein, partial [Campylobacter coli]|nr:WG repeat-containing protein [Campylobacter coli]
WGFIDRSGKFVIKPKFDSIWDFSEGVGGKIKCNHRKIK